MAQLKRNDGMCPACPPGIRRKGVDEHHVLPVEHGGPMAGVKVKLGPSCHHDLHTYERSIMNGTIADMPTTVTPVLRVLVEKAIAQHKQFIEQGGVAPDARRRIVAELSAEQQKKAHVIRDHYGFGSLEKMIVAMIDREFHRITHGK